jgi:hypothetical protein
MLSIAKTKACCVVVLCLAGCANAKQGWLASGRLYTDTDWHVMIRPAIYCNAENTEGAKGGLPIVCTGGGFTIKITTTKVP